MGHIYDPQCILSAIPCQYWYTFQMNENDLRVQRSRRLLQEALIQLVIEDGYDHVTIRDITKEAQVGYKTFFRHYDSKEALLQEILNNLIIEFQKVTPPPTDSLSWEENTVGVLFVVEHSLIHLLEIQEP